MTRTASGFSRDVPASLLAKLQPEPLFTNKLLPDICNSKSKRPVFPAIREGRIDFYHRGGKLFTYDGTRFTTHIKYASVATAGTQQYVGEDDLRSGRIALASDFMSAYGRMKENCSLYSGVEAQGVSDLYAVSAYACCPDNVVILDIEVSLSGDGIVSDAERGSSQNRIDLLLFNKKTRTLRFYEAKHYSNPELWASPARKPAVIAQLERYKTILGSTQRRKDLLDAYGHYVDSVNQLFFPASTNPLRLPPPENLEDDAVLFVFGYDKGQQARIDALLVGSSHIKGHRLRTRGATGGFDARQLWERVRRQ